MHYCFVMPEPNDRVTMMRSHCRISAGKLLSYAAVVMLVTPPVFAGNAPTRPNILWISCEDISPQLGCYGDPQAVTPNLDRLASEGTRFTHAFSCHGVCAPSRTGIITGMYPISLGANHMRSKVKLPDHVNLFPQYLREAGYYCTNNSKTDYNLVWDQRATWDESSGKAHWKNRGSPDQPFFAVFNLTMTHESKVWPKGWIDVVSSLPESDRHRAQDVIVPPLYPDTPDVRADLARLADLISVMDLEVGRLLQELDDAGLADDTIVMFWSDHGNGLPRAKRWTYDSGSRVPLIVRVPERFQDLAGAGIPGSVDERMVSLIDLGPTVLNLAGIETPGHMHGRSFLGSSGGAGREFIFGARDRLDERFDMVRTVRSRDFRYVRNLMPWRPALQTVAYAEQNEILKEMRRLLAANELSPASAQWFAAPRAAEELYDLNADPWELVNLAGRPEHQETLNKLSAACDEWQLSVLDAHLLPEIMLDEAAQSGRTRWQILQGAAGRERASKLLAAAKETARLNLASATQTATALDDDPAVRWWQVTRMARAEHPESRLETLIDESEHSHAAIKIAVAAGLARAGRSADAARILGPALKDDSEFVRHAAILEIDEAGSSVVNLLQSEIANAGDGEYVQRLTIHATEP